MLKYNEINGTCKEPNDWHSVATEGECKNWTRGQNSKRTIQEKAFEGWRCFLMQTVQAAVMQLVPF